jgi:hypothetical protein
MTTDKVIVEVHEDELPSERIQKLINAMAIVDFDAMMMHTIIELMLDLKKSFEREGR